MKRIVILLTSLTLVLSLSIPVFAFTPTYKPPKLPTIPEIRVELPEGVKEAIEKQVEEDMKNINIKLLDTPKVTENRYIHGRVFWDHSRLQVSWDKVDEATSYEIKVTKPDGTEKIYTSDYTSFIVNKNQDDFITDCVIGGKVRIRAVKDDGALYSLWSDEDTIACNVLFH